jgi:hypothetical protein
MDRRLTSVSTIQASGFRDMGGPRARCTGRNHDRRREALSPRGVLYAWAWSEMARKARPDPRFPPTVSSSFWVSPPSAVLVAAQILSK